MSALERSHGRAVGLAFLILAAACGHRESQPAAVPQNRATATALHLPDDACLRLGVERYPDDRRRQAPGSCRLHGEQHPPTGRRCVAPLRDLGGEDLELHGCYRQEGTRLTLDHATLDRAHAEILFEFDGKQCWILNTRTWATVSEAVKAFVSTTTGCTRFRDDHAF